ncbi:MAG: hypothetical protein GXP25_16460 [Planctomycetes bacterium]|nr:hypothetical protein [Planctomycetota bacterium]
MNRLGLVLSLLLFAAAVCFAREGDAKSNSVAASFDDDWVVVTVQGPACRLDVRTEKKPTAIWLDGKKLDSGWSYSDESKMTTIPFTEGTHSAEIALLPNPKLPPTEADIPIAKAEGSGTYGQLKAYFGPCGMQASGIFTGEAGRYECAVRCAPIGRKRLEASLSAEGNPSAAWQLDKEKMTEKKVSLMLFPETKLALNVEGGRVRSNPVRGVAMKQTAPVVVLPHFPAKDVKTEDGILIEGEKFSAHGGGEIKLSGGGHKGAHGNDNIYSFGTAPGQWVEWTFPVPAAGRYRLVIVGASDHERPIRRLEIDGKVPCPACELLQFARTGGWARNTADEWWAFRVADASGSDMAFDLSEGKHTVRLTVVGDHHLNVDYLLFAPVK